MIRPVTQDCYESLMMDEWPRAAAICDFGIDSQKHYEALYDPIRKGEIKIEDLERVLGSGPAITELVNQCPANRYKGIVFETAWDDIQEEDDE